MKRATKRMIRRMSYVIPRYLWLYRASSMYTDNYLGINNSDMIINGELRFLNSLIHHQWNVVLDIGANRGQWTESVLSLFPNANIHCFEPSPKPCACLKNKHFPPTVVINQVGVGARAGVLPMYIYGESSELNSVYQDIKRTPNRIEEIEIITVDEYCQKNGLQQISFMKIDVEGHDLAVIYGAKEMLQQGQIRIVQFEYGSGWIIARNYLKDLFEFMDGFPYSLFRIMPYGLMSIKEYAYELDNFRHANYVLVHNDFRLPDDLRVVHK